MLKRYLLIRTNVVTVLLVFCAARCLCAHIVAEALLVFPADTESLEYDNLAILRNLPAYRILRQQFAGIVLQQAKLAITKCGIQEEQVDEMVVGSTPTGLYGLFGGTFNGSVAKKIALKKGIPNVMINRENIFCPGAGTCLFFLEDSIAAFGTEEQLRTMLDTRQGIISSLRSNRDLTDLISAADQDAPVRGVALGQQLKAVIAHAFGSTIGKHIDWIGYSAFISTFAYSVHLDNKAHVSATVKCKTSAQAILLSQMLGALTGLQIVGAQIGKDQTNIPFGSIQISASDRTLEFKMDSPILAHSSPSEASPPGLP